MDFLMAKLMLNTNLCLIRSAKDAVIHYDKICRTCLGTDNVVSMFNITYENLKFVDLLEQHVSIQVQEHDALPSQICNSCITDLINLHMFKKKCLQTQVTLEEIIKYSEARNAGIVAQSYNLVQVPFVYQEFLTSPENSQIKKIQKSSLSKIVKNNNRADNQNVGNKQSNSKNNSDKTISVNDCTNLQMEVIIENNRSPLKLEYINEIDEWSQSICFKEGDNNTAETEHKIIKNQLTSESINVKELETDNKIEQQNEMQEQEKKLARKLVCNICKERFDSIHDLKQHRKDTKHYRVRRTTCYICGKLVGRHLSSHLRTHTLEKPYKCNICDKAFSLGSNLQRHIKSHSGEKHFMCEICGKGYTRQDTLKEHKVIHSGEFPFTCKYCGETFNHVMKHRFHVRKHKIKNGEFGSGLNKCQKISEEDASKLKKCTCEVCHKIYSSRASLYTHKFVHGEKKFSCNMCGKKFRTRVVLCNHYRIHTGEKPYTCKECGKSFTTVSSLKTHILVHTGEKPYSCKTCSKSFKQRAHLKYHMRTHSGEKPYECDFCGKCFAIKGNLIVHIRTHTGETPYVCEICDRGFYDSSSLKKHKKIH